MNNLILLIFLFVCHFLADYTPLSNNWMASAKVLGKPLYPIFCHALIHASLMIIVLLCTSNIQIITILYLFIFQLTTHFLIDVWKGKMNGWFPALQSTSNKWYWTIFGFDQLLHIIIIVLMVQWVSIY